jgi:hypothetical protein
LQRLRGWCCTPSGDVIHHSTTPVDWRFFTSGTKSINSCSRTVVPFLGRDCGNPFPKFVRGRRTEAL